MINGPVAFCDIYGFSSLIREDVQSLSARIFDLLENLRAIPKQGFEIQHFSDSFVVTAKASIGRQEGMRAILEFIPSLLDVAAARGLALRGGISYGQTIVKSNVALGTAVLKAYEYEHMITAPVVWLPESETFENDIPLIVSGKKIQKLTTRDGGVRSGIVIPPHARSVFVSLAQQQMRNAQIFGPATVAAAWASAIDLVIEK